MIGGLISIIRSLISLISCTFSLIGVIISLISGLISITPCIISIFRGPIGQISGLISIIADMEFVKKFTQAMFLKTKLYPKVHKSQ